MALKIKAVEKLVKFNKNDAGEVIKAWATEGHSVAILGLGTMRFGLRAKSVENVNDLRSKVGCISEMKEKLFFSLHFARFSLL